MMYTEFELEWHEVVLIVSFFLVFWFFNAGFGLQSTVLFSFFSTCNALKTWLEVPRIELYRNDLKGNKNEFDSEGLSYL